MSDHTTEDIKENEQPATLENNEETERKARIETLIIKSQKLTKLVTSRKEQLYNWRCRLSILRTNNWNSKCQIEEAKRKTNELRETTLKLTAIRDEKAQIFKDLQAEKHKSHTDEWYNVSKRVIDTARLFPNAFHTYSSSQLMKQLNENQKAAIDMTRLVAALSNKLNSSFDAKVLESNKDLKIIKNI
ncbi:uncharacterized protein [Prorops nasuta]|uniref:uncharacterized protein isoform X2 n=1 Tax=Prorops nasuta TaxID=863751 RepID=UPI0034CFD6B2